MVPLATLLLLVGLTTSSLALVYLSIFCSVFWLPLLVIGVAMAMASRNQP